VGGVVIGEFLPVTRPIGAAKPDNIAGPQTTLYFG
jgi:hypothetical protein